MDLIAKAVTLKSIKLHDSTAKELIFSAKHAVLYTFNTGKGSWEKTETEGCLAVYKQSTKEASVASTVLFILNRLRPENFMCPLSDIKEVLLEGELLMLLLKSGEVMGVWFFEERERQMILTVLKDILTAVAHEKKLDLKPISLHDLLGTRSKSPDSQQQQQQPSILDILSRAKTPVNAPSKTASSLETLLLNHFNRLPPRTSLKEFTGLVCQFLTENPQSLASLHRELSLKGQEHS